MSSREKVEPDLHENVVLEQEEKDDFLRCETHSQSNCLQV